MSPDRTELNPDAAKCREALPLIVQAANAVDSAQCAVPMLMRRVALDFVEKAIARLELAREVLSK